MSDVKRVRSNTFEPTFCRYAAVWIVAQGEFEGEEGIHSEIFSNLWQEIQHND